MPTKVPFSSVRGEWHIKVAIQIKGARIANIESTTEFGTAYTAYQACRNTADSFDEAAADFIGKVLNHPEVLKQLQK